MVQNFQYVSKEQRLTHDAVNRRNNCNYTDGIVSKHQM